MTYMLESHHIVIGLDLHNMMSGINAIDQHFRGAVSHANHSNPFFVIHFSAMVNGLGGNLHNSKKDIKEFLTTFQGHGLKNGKHSKPSSIIGSFAAHVFGFTTDDDIISLVQQVNGNLKSKEDIVNQQVSAINATECHIEKVRIAWTCKFHPRKFHLQKFQPENSTQRKFHPWKIPATALLQ